MRKHTPWVLLAAGIVTLALVGCGGRSSTPSHADLMRGYAADGQARVDLKNRLAQDWERGSKLVATGEKRIQEGEDLLRKGREEVEQGTQELTEGKRLMEESERLFQENYPGLPLSTGE